jgi:hypothetical protein
MEKGSSGYAERALTRSHSLARHSLALYFEFFSTFKCKWSRFEFGHCGELPVV